MNRPPPTTFQWLWEENTRPRSSRERPIGALLQGTCFFAEFAASFTPRMCESNFAFANAGDGARSSQSRYVSLVTFFDWAPPRSGNTNKLARMSMMQPASTTSPKRCVGGKSDSTKIANPAAKITSE